MTEATLIEICRKWQRRLRLQDWDIKIIFVRQFEMRPDVLGCCEPVIEKKVALIKIVDPIDYPTDCRWGLDVENTIIHELLHCHFEPVSKDGGVFVEQAIESITSGLLSAEREDRE